MITRIADLKTSVPESRVQAVSIEDEGERSVQFSQATYGRNVTIARVNMTEEQIRELIPVLQQWANS